MTPSNIGAGSSSGEATEPTMELPPMGSAIAPTGLHEVDVVADAMAADRTGRDTAELAAARAAVDRHTPADPVLRCTGCGGTWPCPDYSLAMGTLARQPTRGERARRAKIRATSAPAHAHPGLVWP